MTLKAKLATLALCSLAVAAGADPGPATASAEAARGAGHRANDAPTFTDVRRAVHTGAIVNLTPLVDDPDQHDHHRLELLSAPLTGSAAVSANGRHITYAAPATAGVDTFTYRATDRAGLSVDGTARIVVYDDATLATCRQDSTVTPAGVLDTRTKSNGCAYYGQTPTRVSIDGPVVMDYFVNWPSNGSAPKAVVVLIGGGDFNMAIRGNLDTGAGDVTGGANNFVVRTAQLLADAGYLAVALDRPVPGPRVPPGSTDATTATDYYRVSVDHAVDILTVLKSLDTRHLPVFLMGTSRGSMSVVAQNLIATGISTSSTVTFDSNDNGRRLWVGKPSVPNLIADYVHRPTHVLWHEQDGCIASTPTGSRMFYESLLVQGKGPSFNIASGGVRVMATGNGVSPDICGPLNFHGYMGIENTVLGYLTTWFDQRVAALGHDKPPHAAFAEVSTAAGVPVQVHLAGLTHDHHRAHLSYALPGTATSFGGQAVLNGRTVTYTPPAGMTSGTDYFVYVVTDGRGGVGAAVVTVRVGG